MLSRQMLEGMGLSEAQVEAIVEAHSDSLKGIKADRDKYKAQADKYEALEKELAEVKALNSGDWQKKYEALQTEYDGYKSEQAEKETLKAKQTAYKKLCEEAGVSKTAIDNVIAVTDLKDYTLSKDGSFKDAEKLVEGIKEKWSGFITTADVTGARTQTPPSVKSGAKMTYDEINAIKDATKRQEAIANNLDTYMKGV